MTISQEEIEREKKRLPRGWGRFGKALDQLAAISEANESLVSSCVGLNPTFKHRAITLAGGLYEMTKATNVVLAITSERLIIIATGFAGGPREHVSIPVDGLEVVSRSEKAFALRWPDGEMHVNGAAKQQIPEFLDSVAASARTPDPEGQT